MRIVIKLKDPEGVVPYPEMHFKTTKEAKEYIDECAEFLDN